VQKLSTATLEVATILADACIFTRTAIKAKTRDGRPGCQ
jgi:hypothetical protein